jgi:hypothetical protein
MTKYKTHRFYDGVTVKWLVTNSEDKGAIQFDTQEEANKHCDECNEGALFRDQLAELQEWFYEYERKKEISVEYENGSDLRMTPLPEWVREFLPGAKNVPDGQLASIALEIFTRAFQEEFDLPRTHKELDRKVIKRVVAWK